jgi:hypothetical protein
MKTILYNTETNKPITGYLEGGYKVDGKPQAVELPIVELEVISTVTPEITAVQKLSSEWVVDMEEGAYRLVWTVMDKTEQEIIADIEQAAQEAEEILKGKANERLINAEMRQIYTESESLTDEQALESVDTFPPYRVGVGYETGQRFQWSNKLWKVLQAHTSAVQWRPDEAVSLYVEVTPTGVIAEWKQPAGAHDAYQVGDRVTWNGKTWENTIANNVWEPGVYGWSQL